MSILLKQKGRSEDKNIDFDKWAYALKFAAIPLAGVLYIAYSLLQPWWETMRAPCTKLLSDDEVALLSGKPSEKLSAYHSSSSCSAYYDDVTVRYDKQSRSDSTYGYRRQVEDLRAKLDTENVKNVKNVEEVPELTGAGGRVASAGAVIASERGDTGVFHHLTLVIEQDRNSFVEIQSRYRSEPTPEQRRVFIETVKKKIGISTEFFASPD